MANEKVIELLRSKFDEKQKQFTTSMIKLGSGEATVDKDKMRDDMVRVSGALAMLIECIDELEKE